MISGKTIVLFQQIFQKSAGLSMLFCALFFGLARPVRADDSPFGYLYTTDLLPKKGMEVEQWVTYRFNQNGGDYHLLEGRTEFEYGVTDDFQVSIYANYAWIEAFQNGPNGHTSLPDQLSNSEVGPNDQYTALKFTGVSLEGIYRILSPYKDPLGLALYLEPTLGPGFLELESKILLQKNFFNDKFTLAFNFTYAAEFVKEDDEEAWEQETEVNLELGASYRFIKNWSIGLEALNEMKFLTMHFADLENSGYYLGPVVHYGGKNFFATLTYLRQLPVASYHSATEENSIVDGYIVEGSYEKNRLRLRTGFAF